MLVVAFGDLAHLRCSFVKNVALIVLSELFLAIPETEAVVRNEEVIVDPAFEMDWKAGRTKKIAPVCK